MSALSVVIAHDPTCGEATGTPMSAVTAVELHPLAWPHRCLPGQWSRGTVVMVEQAVEPHPYRMSMRWPAGYPREVCMNCQSAHEEELS